GQPFADVVADHREALQLPGRIGIGVAEAHREEAATLLVTRHGYPDRAPAVAAAPRHAERRLKRTAPSRETPAADLAAGDRLERDVGVDVRGKSDGRRAVEVAVEEQRAFAELLR